MKRLLNSLFVIGLIMASLSLQLACKSTKEITKPETQPITKPTEPPKPVNPFKSDTTKPQKPAVKKVIALNTIHFNFDKSNIGDQEAQLLAQNVKTLRDNPSMSVKIDAYTDHIGGDQYNLRLSERRAQAVLKFYESNGIAASRIIARGLGKAPIPCLHMDTNGPGCRKNRRAESHPFTPNNY